MLKTVKGVTLSAYASYLINGDASGISEEDKRHADAFQAQLGGNVVSCKPMGFQQYHDATQFGALAGDCDEYAALVEDTQKGFEKINVRFFVYEPESEDDEPIIEVTESDFQNTDGNIDYERHTVFMNGVSQICLTKGLPRG